MYAWWETLQGSFGRHFEVFSDSACKSCTLTSFVVLFELVDVGTPVRIVNEPFLVGRRDGAIYFEAHTPLEEDEMPADVRLERLLDGQRDAAGMALNPHLREHMRVIAAEARGVPVNVLYYDTSEVFARVRVVENTVEADPDAPSLSEVREMMREVEAEIASESAETL